MLMATPTCANDAADMDSTTSPNNRVRMKRTCIVIPLAHHPSLALGDALLRRAAWIGCRFSNETNMTSRSQMVLAEPSHSGGVQIWSKRLSFERSSHNGPTRG